MTFLGLLGMIDPPRPEARAAIQTCELAGIKPVMITGDHPLTAEAVARELGLLEARTRGHGPGTGDVERRAIGAGRERDRGLCPRFTGPQAARGHRLAEAGPHRGHDRGRRERRPGTEESRRGHRDGDHGHGRQPRGRRHDADRRQLCVHRRRGGGRPRHFWQYQEVPDVLAVLERRRNRLDGRRHAGRSAAAAERRANPVRQPGHRRTARLGAGGRSARRGPDAPPAARSAARHFHRAGGDR